MPCPILDLARFLVGPWRIERRIADLHSGTTGRLTGEARFVPAPGRLRYDERGTLVFDAYRGAAGQGHWFALDRLGAADVQFDDGRPFHRLDLSSGRADVVHNCPPDHYQGRYRVGGQHRWTLTWLVRGPRKRVLIGTRYTRGIASAAAAEEAPQGTA